MSSSLLPPGWPALELYRKLLKSMHPVDAPAQLGSCFNDIITDVIVAPRNGEAQLVGILKL